METEFDYELDEIDYDLYQLDMAERQKENFGLIDYYKDVDEFSIPTRLLWPGKKTKYKEIIAMARRRRRFLRGRSKRLRRYRVSRGGTRL